MCAADLWKCPKLRNDSKSSSRLIVACGSELTATVSPEFLRTRTFSHTTSLSLKDGQPCTSDSLRKSSAERPSGATKRGNPVTCSNRRAIVEYVGDEKERQRSSFSTYAIIKCGGPFGFKNNIFEARFHEVASIFGKMATVRTTNRVSNVLQTKQLLAQIPTLTTSYRL